jgi:flavin reductase (DIM6/NTAB) family NADH-FMN oxidoreductase RutF
MDPAARKTTLRMLTNGVYIITSRSGEEYGGATVTWISQASFHPPLLMAAIRPESSVYKCLADSKLAAIHVLSAAQQDLAQRFFTPTSICDGRMNGEPFVEGKTKVPVLTNAPAYVECRVLRIIDGVGDHAVIVMEVLEAECRERVNPMRIDQSPWHYGG